MAVVALMLAALAGPVAAQGDQLLLRDASVAPRFGRPSTTIRFGVTFFSRGDRPAVAVRVLIDGRRRTMTRDDAADVEGGVRYVYAGRLVAGRHRIRFAATAADGRRVSVDGGSVWIKVATRATGPDDGTKEGTTAEPAAGAGTGERGGTSTKPDSGSGGDPQGLTGNGTEGSGDPTTPADVDADADADADGGSPTAPGAIADAGDQPDPGRPDEGRDPLIVPALTAPDPGGPSGGAGPAAGAGPTRGSTGAGRTAGPASMSGMEILGLGGGLFDQVYRAYPVMVTTGGTAVVWAAFVIFGKRRRDGEPPAPDEVLAVHAATAMTPIATAELVPVPSPRELPPGVDPDEADLPRWRRPSLLQARKTDPLRTASTVVSLSFADGAAGSLGLVDGAERRRIRYRLVRLLDVPDETTGRELTVLDAGDEVQIVDAYGIYRLVLCPDGVRGWLHKMVLGELVEQDPTGVQAPDGIDEDVLAAFLTTRRQTA